MVVAIGSTTQFALKFEDVIASLLSNKMRGKPMENHSTDALSMRPSHSKDRGNKSTEGRSKSLRDSLKKLCWKCSKPRHLK